MNFSHRDFMTSIFQLVGDYLNLTEILKHSFVLETALKLICKDESQYQEVCVLGLFLFYGFDAPQFNRVSVWYVKLTAL